MRIDKIEWPSTEEVDALRPYIRKVLFALGHHPDSCWVSDESRFGDFRDLAGEAGWTDSEVLDKPAWYPRDPRYSWQAGRHNKRLLARVRRVTGMPVTWRCTIVEVARRLRAKGGGSRCPETKAAG